MLLINMILKQVVTNRYEEEGFHNATEEPESDWNHYKSGSNGQKAVSGGSCLNDALSWEERRTHQPDKKGKQGK